MRRRWAALIALSLLASCAPDGAPASEPSAPPSFRPGAFTRPASLSGEPCGFEVSERDVWILTCAGTLLKLPKSGTGAAGQHLGGEVLSLDGLARGGAGRMWGLVSLRKRGTRAGKVVPVDVTTGALGTAVDVGPSVPMSATEAGGRSWVAMLDGRLLMLEGGSIREVDRGAPLVFAAAETSSLWTLDENGDATLRDGATGAERARLAGIASEPIAAAAAFGVFWAATPSKVVRADPAGGAAAPVSADGTVNGIEPCGEMVWLSQPDFGVRSMSPDGRVNGAVPLDVAPRYLACDGPMLWVLAEDGRVGSIQISG